MSMFMGMMTPATKCCTAVVASGTAIRLSAQTTPMRRAGVVTTLMRSQKIARVLKYTDSRNERLPPGQRDSGTSSRAQAPSAQAI